MIFDNPARVSHLATMVGDGGNLCVVCCVVLCVVWSLMMSQLNLNDVVAEYGPKTIGVADGDLGNYPLPVGYRYRKPKGKPYLRNADGSCVIVVKEGRKREKGSESVSVPDGGFTTAEVAGWNFATHRTLKPANFKDECHYWTWRRDTYAKALIAECDAQLSELAKYTPEERKARANAAREKGRISGAVEKLAADPAILAGLSEELKAKLLALLSGG